MTTPRWQFLALEVPRDTGFGRHHHGEHQLVVVDRGVIGLRTDTATWAIPAGCGAWLGAGDEHEVLGVVDGFATFAYLRAPVDWTPPPPGAIAVDPLLRDALTALATPGARRGERRARLEAVLLDEVGALQPVPLLLPLPSDPTARAVAELLLADPADDRTIDQLGALVGASARTLQRRFTVETGLGWRDWRRRARLQRATAELGRGASVTATAHTCGFSSVSAFVSAFGSEVGQTPAAWARARPREVNPAGGTG